AFRHRQKPVDGNLLLLLLREIFFEDWHLVKLLLTFESGCQNDELAFERRIQEHFLKLFDRFRSLDFQNAFGRLRRVVSKTETAERTATPARGKDAKKARSLLRDILLREATRDRQRMSSLDWYFKAIKYQRTFMNLYQGEGDVLIDGNTAFIEDSDGLKPLPFKPPAGLQAGRYKGRLTLFVWSIQPRLAITVSIDGIWCGSW